MRPEPTPLRILAAAITGLACVLALGACGSSSSTGGGTTGGPGTSSAGGGASSKYAQEAGARVAKAMEPITTFDGPTEPAGEPPSGKEIAIVKVIPSSYPNHQAEGAEAAIEAAGWTSRVFTADGTPHGFQTSMAAALATKPDGIILCSMPAALMQGELAEAKAAGVQVVAMTPGLVIGNDPAKLKLLNEVNYNTPEVGELLGDWVVQAAPEGAEALALTSPEFEDLTDASENFRKAIERAGPEFSIGEVVASPVTDAGGGQAGVSRLASPMRAHPDADYMFINSENWVPTFLQAAQSANRAGQITALGTDGEEAIPLIQEGQPIVVMGSDSGSQGWYAVDSLIRKWNDRPQQEYEVQTVLVDGENADEYESGVIEVKYDLAREWEKLWK